jgi:pimeloyl-ACP methyl ester carboxylesterase
VWDRLPRISAPTLVQSGRYDGLAPVANCEAIASRVPGAEHRVYDGGHAFPFQDPAAWPDAIAFLRG